MGKTEINLKKPSDKAVRIKPKITAEQTEILLREMRQVFATLGWFYLPDDSEDLQLVEVFESMFDSEEFQQLCLTAWGRGFVMGFWTASAAAEGIVKNED